MRVVFNMVFWLWVSIIWIVGWTSVGAFLVAKLGWGSVPLLALVLFILLLGVGIVLERGTRP